jgi:uncharacterized protein YbjQ (UPF0145 family)
MGNGHNNDDDDDRKDLTRLEDLSEFLHEDDPDLESKLGDFNQPSHTSEGTSFEVTQGLDINQLSDQNEMEEGPPAIPHEKEEKEEEEEEKEETSTDSLLFESTEEAFPEIPPEINSEINSDENPTELLPVTFDEDLSLNDSEEGPTAEREAEIFSDLFQESEIEFESEVLPTSSDPERFEEVKSFAQNFSYGQIQGGGNPPFSLVIRHLKYEEDKESILTLLSEFGLVTEQNQAETQKALELGFMLIPQISEYSAIILAHKLRRFDCDIEVGLSDEVHPSRSGEHNPKGLVKRESLRQNVSETYKRDEDQSPLKEIIVATTAQLEGHIIKKYIGVQTSFAIVDEEELERLKFVQNQERNARALHDYHPDENEELSSERAFQDYKNSFDFLFISLVEELKSKAQKEKANALLGLNYQLQLLPFEKTSNGKNCYQLTASATMAQVIPESLLRK